METDQNMLWVIAALYRISTSLLGIKDTEQLLDFFLNEASQVSSSEIAALWLYDKDNKCLAIKKQIGLGGDEWKNYKVEEGNSCLWKAFKDNKICNLLAKDHPDASHDPICQEYNIKACFVLPIEVGAETIGVFYLGRLEEAPFSVDDERLLTILVNNCSMAYENLLSRDTLQSKLSELESFQKLVIDRELKMIELKSEISRLNGLLNIK